jgi:hypothetical protein
MVDVEKVGSKTCQNSQQVDLVQIIENNWLRLKLLQKVKGTKF